MAKLGYTWYPKDWGNSEAVFELNLIQRGLYRELIDLAMLNDNKTKLNLKIWSRKWNTEIKELDHLIHQLVELNLIELRKNIVFIESCEPRLNLVRGGRKGGLKSKPTEVSKRNLLESPVESLLEATSKPKEKKRKEKEIKNKENSFLDLNTEYRNQFLSHYQIDLTEYKKKLKIFKIGYDMERPEAELKQHFFNWFKTQDFKKSVKVVEHWNKNRKK